MVTTVIFWQACGASIEETFDSKVQAKRAIAKYIRGRLHDLRRIRHAFVRGGSAYRDGAVTVWHKSGGREFGAYIREDAPISGRIES